MTDKDFKDHIDNFCKELKEINNSIIEMKKTNFNEFSNLKVAQSEIKGSIKLNAEKGRSMMDGKIAVLDKKCSARHMKLIYFILFAFVSFGVAYWTTTNK